MFDLAPQKTAEKPFDPRYFKEELAAALIIIEQEDVPPDEYAKCISATDAIGARVPRDLRALYRLLVRIWNAAHGSQEEMCQEMYLSTLRLFENLMYQAIPQLQKATTLGRLNAEIDTLFVDGTWHLYLEKDDEQDPEPEPIPGDDDDEREESPGTNDWKVGAQPPPTKH